MGLNTRIRALYGEGRTSIEDVAAQVGLTPAEVRARLLDPSLPEPVIPVESAVSAADVDQVLQLGQGGFAAGGNANFSVDLDESSAILRRWGHTITLDGFVSLVSPSNELWAWFIAPLLVLPAPWFAEDPLDLPHTTFFTVVEHLDSEWDRKQFTYVTLGLGTYAEGTGIAVKRSGLDTALFAAGDRLNLFIERGSTLMLPKGADFTPT